MAVISPGKPFLMQEASADWVINRSILYEKGISLYGPPAKAIATPIARAELMRAIQGIVREWRVLITHTELIRPREEQAYAILTMCRTLYCAKHDGTLEITLRFIHLVLGQCESDPDVAKPRMN